MKILVINSGSSSLKFQLLEDKKMLCKGMVDGIGLKTCQFHLSAEESKKTLNVNQNISCNDHHEALDLVLASMVKNNIIPSLKVIDAIGHRVVHGGEKYHQAVLITPEVSKNINKLSELAPLHNPPNLKGIEACHKLLKDVPQVAVFDTSFHGTIPEKAYLYALPYELYSKDSIRRYGFHGTSHQYVSEQAIKLLGKKRGSAKTKIVSCHLGNGSSVCAIVNGKSVDTSMGLTPLEGIPMGTRSGDIDPAIIFHLLKQHKISAEQLENLLNKESGLKGISGISSDMRTIWAATKKSGPQKKRAALSLQILAYRIAKYIGSYAATMNGIDAIIFTAGIGEHAYYIRRDVCEYLKFLGVEIDNAKNQKDAITISKPKSKIKVFVIPTNEEQQIAKETMKILKNRSRGK